MKYSPLMLVWLVACGSSGSASGPDATLTDPQVCMQACTAQIDCGLLVDIDTCDASCGAGASHYHDCIRAAGTDCNALAACFFEVQCGVKPTGTESCNTAAACEGTCNVSNPTPACQCSCVDALDPQKAIDLLVNNFCASARCPQYCTPGATFDGVQCNQCFLAQCSAEAGQCMDN